MSEPLIAVVIPAYNAEPYLRETLGAVVAQSYTQWRAVVVDDGSTDKTADIARELAGQDERITLKQQENTGESIARNRAMSILASAGPKYLACVDADDLMLPDAFATLVSSLEGRPDAVGAYGLAEYIDDQSNPISPGAHSALQRQRKTFKPVPNAGASGSSPAAGAKALWASFAGRDLQADEDTGFDTLAIYGGIWPPAVALSRFDVVQELGGFTGDISYMEDWDFFLRLARTGPLVFIDKQVAWYRRHSRNSGTAGGPGSPLPNWDASFLEAVAVVRRRAWESPANTHGQRQDVARAYRRDGLSLAKREMEALVRDLARPSGWGRSKGHLAWAGYGLWAAAQPHPVKPSRKLVQALDRARVVGTKPDRRP